MNEMISAIPSYDGTDYETFRMSLILWDRGCMVERHRKPALVINKQTGQYKCIQVIRVKADEKEMLKIMRLPMKILVNLEQQRVFIRPSKMLYFNRLAKTGSQSFGKLLFKLGQKHKFVFVPKRMKSDKICDSDQMSSLFYEMDSMLKTHIPAAFMRHYSFIDFDDEEQPFK